MIIGQSRGSRRNYNKKRGLNPLFYLCCVLLKCLADSAHTSGHLLEVLANRFGYTDFIKIDTENLGVLKNWLQSLFNSLILSKHEVCYIRTN